MDILRPAIAGTLESSDIFIKIEPLSGQGIIIELDSIVEKQFGDIIKKTIASALGELNIKEAYVSAVDKGALDCTIKARVQTAAQRAGGGKDEFPS